MSALGRHNSVRRGVTLVELLVVVGIILLLLLVAVRQLPLALEGRRIRETSRAVTIFLGKARSHAIQTRRPHGVLFEPFEQQQEASIVLREVEVPPLYAGDTTDAALRVSLTNPGAPIAILQALVRVVSFSDDLVRPGDLIQFNHQGPWYTVADIPPNPDNDGDGFIDFDGGQDADSDGWYDTLRLTMTLDLSEGFTIPWSSSTWSSDLPFAIRRQPVPTAAEPLQLPRAAVIDLAASGMDSVVPPPGLTPPSSTQQTMVMFSPNGGVDRLYFNHPATGYGGYPVTEPLYFLVGRWDRMPLSPAGPAKAEDGLKNWQDANNLWVALNAQTGLVTVAELHADLAPGTPGNPNPATYVPSGLYAARKFAREAQIAKGGR